MRVFLLNPPYKKGFIRSARSTWMPISNSNWFPIYLAYATGALEQAGHEAKLIDACVTDHTHSTVIQVSRDFKPEMLVIYTSSRTLENDIQVAEAIKNAVQCRVVFVGPWCSGMWQKILQASRSIDVVVRHEIEPAVLDLASGKDLKDILGISWRSGDELIENPMRPYMTTAQLDALPFVTEVYRKHLDVRWYREASLRYPYIDLFAGRGCFWGLCTFCLWPQSIHKNGSYRMRSLENVLDEFEAIHKNMPYVKDVFFQDDALMQDFARKFSEGILKRNLKITWSGYARPDFDYETLHLMKKAGCHCLHVGFESGSKEILKTIKKGISPETMSKFARSANKAGILIHGDFLIGSPGETRETITETIGFARSLNLSVYQFLVCDPYEGTEVDSQFKVRAEKGQSELSHEELVRWKVKALKSCLLRPVTILNALKSCRSTDDLMMYMWGGINFTRNVVLKTYE